MKKILKSLQNIILWLIWTFLFIFIIKAFFLLVWNFDILSVKHWRVISTYWNKGGSFNTYQDLLFLLFLLSIPFLYIITLRKILKTNFIKLFTSLISRVFDRKIEEPERVVIKGMKTNQQYINDIKNELTSLKPEKNKESSLIRTNILKKINEEIKK